MPLSPFLLSTHHVDLFHVYELYPQTVHIKHTRTNHTLIYPQQPPEYLEDLQHNLDPHWNRDTK